MSSLPVLIVRLFIPPDLPAWRKVDVHAKVGLQFQFEDGTKAQVSQGEGHVFLHLPEKNEKNQSKETRTAKGIISKSNEDASLCFPL